MKAFTDTEEEKAAIRIEEEEEVVEESVTPMDVSSADAPFLERAEGQLLIKRLLLEEKKTGSREFYSVFLFYYLF